MSTNPGQMSLGCTSPALRGWPERLQRAVADVQQARLAADGQRAAADDLHPRVLLRVVRGGDAHAAFELELADRVVDHLGADQPEVEHVGAAVGRALDQSRRHRRRRHAHVAPDRDRARLEVLDVGASDRVRALLVELGGVEAADVVRLEDLGIEHALTLAQALSARRIETFLVTTITRWNASSQRCCSSISSARPSSSPRAIPRSCGGASTRSSSTSRTASRRTAGSWRSSPATPSWPRSASRRRTRTTPSARSAPPPGSSTRCTASGSRPGSASRRARSSRTRRTRPSPPARPSTSPRACSRWPSPARSSSARSRAG